MEGSVEHAVGYDFILKKLGAPENHVWICISEQTTGRIRADCGVWSDPFKISALLEISQFSL